MSLVAVPVPVPTQSSPVEGIPAEVPEGAAPPAQQNEAISRHFSALAKKERALVKQHEALKAERAAIEAEKARVAEIEAKYGTRPANPREALARYGFDYKTATEFELNDGASTAEFLARQAQEEIKKLREETTDKEKRQAEELAQRAEAEKTEVIKEFQGEIQGFVDDKPDDYELIRFHDAYQVVYLTIAQHYEKTGKLLSIPEGANIVEKYLEKKMDDFSKSSKKLAKTRQGDPPAPESGFSRQPEVTAQRRTLDNTVTASTPTLMKSSHVENDRIKRALAALERR